MPQVWFSAPQKESGDHGSPHSETMDSPISEVLGGIFWGFDWIDCDGACLYIYILYVGLSPLPVTVTTRIITFLVGDPYKPSFATVTGRGDNPNYMYLFMPIGSRGCKGILS